MRGFFASPADRVFGEESADECRTRFSAAIDAILSDEPAHNVAIVSHGTVISLYAAPFFNLQPIDLWQRIVWPSYLVIDTSTKQGVAIVESLTPLLPGEG
jgi:broad specificity phosphatase PhoE